MAWYELNSADDPKLDELAKRYNLHPLHVEDARSADERTKVDQSTGYTFAVLKPVRMIPGVDGGAESVSFSTIDVFAGHRDGEPFFITIAEESCANTAQALARARREGGDGTPARLLYLILDTVVDLYFPAIDHYDDRIDELEDRVISQPEPDTLQQVFAIKRQLIDLRRVLVRQ